MFYPHAISHVNVVLRGPSQNPIVRGMNLATSHLGYLYRFLIKGSSLDTLIINLPGRFMDEAQVWEQLEVLKPNGYVESLCLKLTPQQARRVQDYFQSYEEFQLHQIYGALASDPLKGEGAGCSAFAMSVLEVLGLLSEELRNAWGRELRIPVELMSSQTKRARVGFLGFILGQNPRWSDLNPCYVLKFWDPEKMYDWCKKEKVHPQMSGLTVDPKTQTLLWDVRSRPVPELNLREHFLKIAPQIQKELRLRGELWSAEKLRTLLTE